MTGIKLNQEWECKEPIEIDDVFYSSGDLVQIIKIDGKYITVQNGFSSQGFSDTVLNMYFKSNNPVLTIDKCIEYLCKNRDKFNEESFCKLSDLYVEVLDALDDADEMPF